MQIINVEVDNESFHSTKSSEINFANILGYVWENTKKEDYPWLWGVDAYGLTIFNIHQTPHLIKELTMIKNLVEKDGVKSDIEKLIKFINDNMAQHLYLKFIGD